jgi:predicted esterase
MGLNGQLLVLPLHDQQDLPPSSPAALSTPVFWGHGTGDEKVPLQLGRKSVECLRSIGVDVSWHAYSGLGHWFSSMMLGDVAQFLQAKTNWEFQGESQVINTTD